MTELDLPFGRSPLRVRLPDATDGVDLAVLEPPRPRAALADVAGALHAAAARAVSGHNRPGVRVALILSDASRDEPRALLYAAARQALAAVSDRHITLCIANGTHPLGPPEALGLPAEALRTHPLYNHDSRDERALVELGMTRRGTSVRIARVAAEADLVLATGRIRPHYFAGYGAGAKAIFPGLGGEREIRKNHRLKADPTSRLGRVAGNACREDLEEATALVGGARALVNVVQSAGGVVAVVAGDVVRAFREGVAQARPLYEVPSPFADGADVVVTSDAHPVTYTLYQSCKLLPPAGMCLAPGGRVVLAAACSGGTGPLDTIMKGIWELGVRAYLPPPQEVALVSKLPDELAARTFALPAPSVEAAVHEGLARVTGRRPRLLVLPRASELVPISPRAGCST